MMFIRRGSTHRNDSSSQLHRLISCLDTPLLHNTRDTKMAEAHFACICSLAETSGESERVPCRMQLVQLMLKGCANVALFSKNSRECIRMLLKHLQRLAVLANTDLESIMRNQRSKISKQVENQM